MNDESYQDFNNNNNNNYMYTTILFVLALINYFIRGK